MDLARIFWHVYCQPFACHGAIDKIVRTLLAWYRKETSRTTTVKKSLGKRNAWTKSNIASQKMEKKSVRVRSSPSKQ